MFKTNSASVAPERGTAWETRWLLHEDAGPTRDGMMAITRIDPDGAFGQDLDVEQAMFVLDGAGTVETADGTHEMSAGAFAFAPPGARAGWRAGSGGLRLLRIFGGVARPRDVEPKSHDGSDPSSPGRSMAVTRAEDVRFMTITNPEQGFYNMRATFLVNEQVGGSRHLAVGQSVFEDPRNSRPMHRHPNAQEFLFVLKGSGFHIEADGREVLIAEGDACITMAGEPHGFRFDGPDPAHFIFGFLGVKTFEEAGTELVPVAGSAT